jgi:predicted transcriptional regulator
VEDMLKRKKDNESDDYSDSEFTDLMDKKKIQQDIRQFYDRFNELMNPIESERLSIDSVAQIKNAVRNFYQTKQLQCQ